MSRLEFVGCFKNNVISVRHFQLENSAFFGNGWAIVNGTVLSIEESTVYLDRVAFISAVQKLQISQVPEGCCAGKIDTTDAVIGILLRKSSIRITQSRFEGNKVGLGAIIYDEFGSDIIISNTVFAKNSATQYCNNNDMYCCFPGGVIVCVSEKYRSTVKMYHSKFEKNVGVAVIIHGDNTYMSTVSIIHSIFVDNTVIGPRTLKPGGFQSNSLVTLEGVMVTVSLSEFINNRASTALINIQYSTTAENFSNNVLIDNRAVYDIYIDPTCRPGLSLSLGSSRCIQCSENWHQHWIGIVVAAFIAGIALVVFMLALNMTVAVGTLNGILFYVHIVAANTKVYFLPFTTPDFVTVFISWLNLDFGFDVCFYVKGDDEPVFLLDQVYKALLQLAFPAYVILLVIVVIVASECSSKFAKTIGRGNPVAVLATMILLSYAKFFNAIVAASSFLYWEPAIGSRNVDATRIPNALMAIQHTEFKTISYVLLAVSIFVLLLCIIYAVLVFSWQWLLQYQDKALFMWVRYQKLRHFLEPYHAPYVAKYRYWTGLLLFMRVLVYVVSVLNFSLDPRVHLMSIILIVGALILLKGVIAKRVYKNWPLDVIETAIYFNLVAFSALTWYNLDFGGNQIAVAYTSVMIIFVLLLVVIVFHILRYTRLYKSSFVEKTYKWASSKLLEKKPKEQPPNDAPEELDGYRLERSVPGDEGLPTITYSVVEITQSVQNQEQNYTD